MKKTDLLKTNYVLFTALCGLFFIHVAAWANTIPEENKVLVVISSDKHGFWLPEVLEPYRLLEQAGFLIEIASPKGSVGKASGQFRLSSKDKSWLESSTLSQKLKSPLPLESVNSATYQAVYFAGGAGPMFDLVNNKEAHRISREIYEQGGIVSADCHGPVALIHVKLSNGERLIKGRKLTAKANSEEGRWARKNYPFLLEDEIAALGGQYSSAAKGQEYVVIDGRIITGQNPASAIPMAEALINQLQSIESPKAFINGL